MRADWRRALLFASGFAVVMTGIGHWAEKNFTSSFADFVGMAFMVLNVVGTAAGWLLQIAAAFVDERIVEWSASEFVIPFLGCFVAGLVYAWLFLAVRRAWARSPMRAVLYPLALAAVGWLAFNAGVARSDAVHCRGDDVGDCDLGVIDGVFWAAAAIVLSLTAVVLLERFLARRSRV